jgi:hypothetical protein
MEGTSANNPRAEPRTEAPYNRYVPTCVKTLEQNLIILVHSQLPRSNLHIRRG